MDVSGDPLLLARWRTWNGAIDCGHSERVFSADELRALCDDVAEQLAAAEVKPGDPVVLALANTAAFPVLLMALLQLRCNPILAHPATPLPELKRIAGAYGALFAAHDFIDGVSALGDGTGEATAAIPVGSMEVSLLPVGSDAGDAASIPGMGVILHPTSGTYGAARYCIRNQGAAVAEAVNYVSRVSAYREARVTVTTPLTHAYAIGFGLVSSIITDSVLAVSPVFNPKRILRLERETPSTILALVPPMVRTLTAMNAGDPGRAMSPNTFYAGAALDQASAEAFEKTFDTRLFTILGATESGAIATTWSSDERLGGVGRPLDGIKASVVDTKRFEDLGEGVGELVVEANSMMQGYLPGDGKGTPASFRTGDVVSIRDDGTVHIVGRARDIINLGGMKVDPAEVEAVILAAPGVADAAVYPGLRDDGVEFVQAAISGTGADPASVREHCLAELAAHKVPAAIHVIDEVPRTPSGKCMKVKCPDYPTALLKGARNG